MWCLAALLLALVAIASPAQAQAQAPALPSGTVQRVVDGDSLWLTPARGGAPLQIRLLGIDAPEICQAWGAEARQALLERVADRPLQWRAKGRDKHGRVLATLYAEGRDLNAEMVVEGHAWSTRYKWDRGPYVKEERIASALGRGLHAGRGAQMPRDFRRSHGPCTSLTPARAADAPAARAPAAPVPSTPAATLWRCDGRTQCSQMRSCAEATFFLQNCPGVKMDGDGDGIPCESQWCRR